MEENANTGFAVKELQILSEDYGYSILWDYYGENLFYIYDNVNKRYFITRFFHLFLAEIKKIPKGSTIIEYDSCMAGFAPFFPEKMKHSLNTVFEELGRDKHNTEESLVVVCTCRHHWMINEIAEKACKY